MKKTYDPSEYFRFSHSARGTFDWCRRAFELNRLYAQPPGKEHDTTLPAEVGKCLHVAFQTYIATQDFNAGVLQLMQTYPLNLCWDSVNPRSFEAAMATYEALVEAAEFSQAYELARIDDKPATEVAFAIELDNVFLPDGRKVIYVGYIDAILQHRVDGTFLAADIKTHRSTQRDRTGEYQFNGQLIPYGLILELVQGKPLTHLQTVYLDCFVDVLEPRVQVYSFTKTREDVQTWLLEFYLDLALFLYFVRHKFFPRTSHGCMSRYGTTCRHLSYCGTRDPEITQAMILGGEEPEEQAPFEATLVGHLEVPEGVLKEMDHVKIL